MTSSGFAFFKGKGWFEKAITLMKADYEKIVICHLKIPPVLNFTSYLNSVLLFVRAD